MAAIPAVLPADLSVTPLAALRSSVVAREGHAMLGRRFTLAELARQKWLLPPSDILLRQWVAAMFVDNGLLAPEVSVQADASPAIFAALVRSTDLLTVMTHAMLHSSMGAGLAPLPAPARTWEIQLGLFWRRKGFFSGAMTQCRDQLEAAFRSAAQGGSPASKPPPAPPAPPTAPPPRPAAAGAAAGRRGRPPRPARQR